MEEQLRVFIADDSFVVRQRLAAMMKERANVELVGQAHNVDGAIHLVRALRPHAIVLDPSLSRGSGFDVLWSIQPAEELDVNVVILTSHQHSANGLCAAGAGAQYFFESSREFEQLRHVLEEISTRNHLLVSADS